VTEKLDKDWDVFISYASEDKDAIARPLAAHLERSGLKVWFDETELQIGDSLSEAIGFGLANSEFGVVIISPSFFAKKWPRNELATLFALEGADRGAILPVWHDVSATDVRALSPLLVDRVALRSSAGAEQLAREIAFKILLSPHEMHLGLARHWVGESGRLVLRRQKHDTVIGQYDWYGENWAGSLNGSFDGNVMLFEWRWSHSDRSGEGFFIHHDRNEMRGRRNLPHLYGAWWFASTSVDINNLVRTWYALINGYGDTKSVVSEAIFPWQFAVGKLRR